MNKKIGFKYNPNFVSPNTIIQVNIRLKAKIKGNKDKNDILSKNIFFTIKPGINIDCNKASKPKKRIIRDYQKKIFLYCTLFIYK
jgi:hypothetical protein